MNVLEQLVRLEEVRDTVARTSAFLFVFLLWVAGVWIWWLRLSGNRRRVSERLGVPGAGPGAARELRLWSQGEEFTTFVPDRAGRLDVRSRIERWRHQARIETPLPNLVVIVTGLIVAVSGIAFMVSRSGIATAGAGLVTAMFLWTYAKQRALRAVALFETQFVDALDLAARSLRAGHPLTGAFQLAAEEIAAPVGDIFKEVCKQQDLGVSLDDALRKASLAHASPDLKLFATSVIIQLESGGNLAEMMGRLAAVIRDRIRLNRHARVLTAQTQLSKRILMALPFVLFVVISVLNPGYMTPLYTTVEGRYLLAMAGGTLGLGVWIMNKMTLLRY